jgi:hypothetical protein
MAAKEGEGTKTGKGVGWTASETDVSVFRSSHMV